MDEKERHADHEARRKREERGILWILVLCALTLAGLVVGSAVLFTT